jgi:hypothetical protein
MTPDPTLATHAERARLGPFVSLHVGPKDMIKLAFASLGLGAFLLSFLFLQDYLPPDQQNDPVVQYGFPAAGGLFILVGIFGIIRLRGRALQFHQGGLVYKEGRRIRPLRFGDVIAVDLDITETSGNTGSSFNGRLAAITRDGQTFSIQPNLEQLDDVIKKLVRGAAPSVMHGVIGELRAGRAVPSGAFTLRPDGIQGREGVIVWTDIADVDEHSDSAMLSNDTKVFLEVRGRNGMKLRSPAGKVRNRSYMSAIVDAMRPAGKTSSVSMTGAALSAQDRLEPAVSKAVRALMRPHWRAAKLLSESNDEGALRTLWVVDPTTNEAANPSPELIEAVQRVFALHNEEGTGVDRYVLSLAPTPDGKWSVSSTLSSQDDDPS